MTFLVRYSEAHDPNHPAPIRVDSEFWFQWLESIRSFRYECENGNISVIKDDRGYWTASKKVDGSLRRKRLGVSQSITLQKLREAVNLLCLTACWKEHLTKQDKRNRESERGQQDYIERLKQKIAALESQKTSVSQSQCDTEVLNRIRTVASKYQSQAKDNPRWYWANKLLADLEAELSQLKKL
jgi:hypothetical protein